jgi:hypothetical protein
MSRQPFLCGQIPGYITRARVASRDLPEILYLFALLLAGCLALFPTLKMDGVSSSEMLVNFYPTTRRQIPEDSILHSHCCENLKYNTYLVLRHNNLSVMLEAVFSNVSNVDLLLTLRACLCTLHISRHLSAC